MSISVLPLMQNADLRGKIVLVRVDHNVIKKGTIKDPFRINSTIPTLFSILAKGGKLILMTHVGRPRNKKTGEITISDNDSVKPIVEYLNKKFSVNFKAYEIEVKGQSGIKGIPESFEDTLNELKEGKIDGIYLPNTRWFKGEESEDEAADALAKRLSEIADIYINDAFGSWQPHTSTYGVTKYIKGFAGLLMQNEINNLDKVLNPKQPFLAVVAGSKFDTKIASLNALLELADHLILGGVIYNAYLCAKYGFTIKGITEDDVIAAKKFVDYSSNFPGKIVELPYIVESDSIQAREQGSFRIKNIHELTPEDKLNFVLDAAPESFDDTAVRSVFHNANSIFVNAVMGFVPNFWEGTAVMYTLIDQNKNAIKLYGGGDTLQEFKNYLPGIYFRAVDDKNYGLFTGGGAVLKAIQEKSASGLPTVKALIDSK